MELVLRFIEHNLKKKVVVIAPCSTLAASKEIRTINNKKMNKNLQILLILCLIAQLILVFEMFLVENILYESIFGVLAIFIQLLIIRLKNNLIKITYGKNKDN